MRACEHQGEGHGAAEARRSPIHTTSMRFHPSMPRSIALLSALLLLAACAGAPDPAGQRAQRAEKARGDIVIGAAWPWEARARLLYRQGMEMALEEVNQGGGVLGRRLTVLREDDHESVNEGRMVAQRFAENPDVVAVIGHLQSYVTIPAAPIYDLAGLVVLAPAATDPELTDGRYPRVFRGTFTDLDAGRQLAELAGRRGYRNVAIYYVRNAYGRSLANAFEERAGELGLRVAARQSYDAGAAPSPQGFEPLFAEWKNVDFDAILLAGETPHAAVFLAEARRHGIDVPVLGGDALGVPELLAAGRAAEGTAIVAAFHPDAPNPEVRRFVEAFRKRYNQPPDAGAALGYDAVHLLADAIRRAGTTVPDRVAEALHATRGWKGVTGPFTYDASGNVVQKPIFTVTVRDGAFQYLDLNTPPPAPARSETAGNGASADPAAASPGTPAEPGAGAR